MDKKGWWWKTCCCWRDDRLAEEGEGEEGWGRFALLPAPYPERACRCGTEEAHLWAHKQSDAGGMLEAVELSLVGLSFELCHRHGLLSQAPRNTHSHREALPDSSSSSMALSRESCCRISPLEHYYTMTTCLDHHIFCHFSVTSASWNINAPTLTRLQTQSLLCIPAVWSQTREIQLLEETETPRNPDTHEARKQS